MNSPRAAISLLAISYLLCAACVTSLGEPVAKPISVRFRPAAEAGGISTDRYNALSKALRDCGVCKGFVATKDEEPDFQLATDISGDLEIRNHESKVLKTFGSRENEAEDAVSTLMGFAVQKSLLNNYALRPHVNGLTRLVDIRALPLSSSCTMSTWSEPENGIQSIPMCSKWRVGVKLSKDSPKNWYVNALILSNDGSIQSLQPVSVGAKLMAPGDRFLFPGVLEASPPIGILEHVVIVWSHTQISLRIDQTGVSSSERVRTNYRDLWLQLGNGEDESVILSELPVKIKANDSFIESPGKQIQQREYTLPKFDIRPYLPEDKNTALYRVLQQAHWLSNFTSSASVGYKQHDWKRPTDVENLQKGIDCSRAIWFVFTRAGLAYNNNNSYLSTAEMVAKNGAMHDEFESISTTGPFEIGDIFVYRDEIQGDGHVVMAIDPSARIAWGSHGYDGRVKLQETKEPAIGVQFQKIRFKKDWLRWDRPNMNLAAVWRYRVFTRQSALPGGQPGLKIFEHACDANKKCGL